MISHQAAAAIVATTVAVAAAVMLVLYVRDRKADAAAAATPPVGVPDVDDSLDVDDPHATRVLADRHTQPRHQAEETREIATRGRRSHEDRVDTSLLGGMATGQQAVGRAAPPAKPDDDDQPLPDLDTRSRVIGMRNRRRFDPPQGGGRP